LKVFHLYFDPNFPSLGDFESYKILIMLTCQSHLFSLEPEFHYINGAYMSPLLKASEEAGFEGMKKKARPYRMTDKDFFTDVETLRGLFAQLVNAENAKRIAIIPAASYGIATVAKNLKVKRGQNIIVAEAQFPSNVYSWRNLAKDKGLKIKTIAYPSQTTTEGRGELWNQHIVEAIDENTCLVSIGHVHWANGTKFDLKRISTRAHAVGALLVIDGTQSVGALPIDVQEMGIDALVCGGYKWLMGPYSLGYAYFNEKFDNGKPLEENWINRKDSENFARLIDYQDQYQPLALRYDMGERSNFILVPMAIAALQQLLAWGADNIQAYCHDLTKDAIEKWREKGFWMEDENWRGKHLFGIQLPKGMAVEKLQMALKERQISVSTRGDFMRISPNVYNDARDIEALTAVLLKI
jgi:selenocysteine lyase/cysteine desulfurase